MTKIDKQYVSLRAGITIENNIPIPANTRPGHRILKYPFDKLTKVGWSFFMPGAQARKLLQSSAYTCGKKLKRKFIARQVVENTVLGARAWRIK